MHFRKELLQAIAELDLRPTRNIAALLSGNAKSASRGSGMQFKEFRHYEEGDDIRHMSWKVTARTGKATLKIYEEDREIHVVIAVDVSGSSLFQSSQLSRREMYTEVLALLGYASLRGGDNIGVLFFDSQPKLFLPPKRSKANILKGLDHISQVKMEGESSDLASSFKFLRGTLKHRSMVIVLSDFFLPPFERELAALSRRHEVMLLHCYDDLEKGLGHSGVYESNDPERNIFYLLDTKSKQNRKLLAEYHRKVSDDLTSICQRSRASYLPLSAEDDYLQRLVRHFRERVAA